MTISPPSDMQDRLHSLFRNSFDVAPGLMTRAPGRVNLIGEHTDYNDGFVLPAAISRQTMVAIKPRDDARIRIIAGDLDSARAEFAIDRPITPDPDAHWTNYIRGMAALLQAEGLDILGADIAIVGDMPQGAGLSSSAALENAVGLALAAIAGQPDIDRTLLAKIGQQTEHEFAGCQCGIMDQLVSARAEQDHALLIDCRSLDATPISLGDDLAIMIVHSGITRGLVAGEYNSRRAECEAAARHFGVRALRDLDLGTLNAEALELDPQVFRRARHVVTEIARTHYAAEALAMGDLELLGALMAESHHSMRDDFEISLPAIDGLVELLATAIGAQGGARMTGGGFGGAVVALLPHDMVTFVQRQIESSYRTPKGDAPMIMVENPCAGASIITL
ncbi:galactokinase [Aquisediminimonas sediminicola]|uniref:galactokinase n=1 Tax=Alteraquisediminimonas sediminicola TaxID=2676787 RepID=UPI001C8EF7FD|nr:galactokinase [Aquisediminimonas sediminicola]